MPAQQFAHFILERALGRGGFGVVYLAHDCHRNHEVALKLLPPQLFADPAERRRFVDEAYRTMQLEHEAIVPVYDFGDVQGQLYMEIRLMRGGTLEDRLARGPLSLEEAGVVMDRICSALDYAHSKSIIHRDLKPANILFDETGAAWLADFGIARTMEVTRHMTEIGTPAYMSPEQINGVTQDARTDVFQMGSVLYQMLTGRLPFDGTTTAELRQHILTAPVPPVRKFSHKIPAACDRVFQKALAKQPRQRFQTAGELARGYRKAAGLPPAVQIVPVAAPLRQPLPAPRPAPARPLGGGKRVFTIILLLVLAGLWLLATQGAVQSNILVFGTVGIVALLAGTFVVTYRKPIFRIVRVILKLVLVIAAIAGIIYLIYLALQNR